MRVLHVHNSLALGGSDTLLLELAREQKRMGHVVAICCTGGPGALDRRATEYGIPVTHLNCPRERIAKVKALYAYLGREKFDVLNSHWGVWLPTALAGFLRGIPRVHTNHSNQPRRLFIEHRVASLFTTKVVSLTPYIEPYIAKWVGVPRRKLAVIPNGLHVHDLETALPVEIDGIPPGAPVVGMIARLSAPKDYPTFMKAAKLVNATHPEVHFIAVGSGQQSEEFKQQAAALGIINFHFLGGRHDVPALLKRMSVNVLATRHEGHPLGLVEAMISGCACVGSDIPSVRYTLEEGKSGLLVRGGDPQALAVGIAQLLDNPALRKRLTTQAREFATYFNVSRMASDYLDLYASIV
jgi:glycosyltransferase involved in cell wall biosynthesis